MSRQVKLSRKLMDGPVVLEDDAITEDVLMHLSEHLPDVVKAYPPGYLISLVRHSACLARDRFHLHEVAAIRLFVRLRWEIAPGYYNEPTIAATLSDTSLRPLERFDALMEPQHEEVWLDAMAFDGPAYWRGQHSDGFGDQVYPEGQP